MSLSSKFTALAAVALAAGVLAAGAFTSEGFVAVAFLSVLAAGAFLSDLAAGAFLSAWAAEAVLLASGVFFEPHAGRMRERHSSRVVSRIKALLVVSYPAGYELSCFYANGYAQSLGVRISTLSYPSMGRHWA